MDTYKGLIEAAQETNHPFNVEVLADFLEEKGDKRAQNIRGKTINEAIWFLQNVGQAFITGSHAYGTPNANSDIDLVILLPQVDLDILLSQTNHIQTYPGIALRFGNLNLIIAQNEIEWNIWKEGTAYLKSIRPVTRLEAIKVFKRLQEEKLLEDILGKAYESVQE